MLIILFGLTRAGKNFVGEILSAHFDMFFWDADSILPIDMQQCIRQKKNFTQPMRDQFTELMIENIKALQNKHPHLIVAQALYKEKNRKQILSAFPNAKFIYIVASQEVISSRLKIDLGPIDFEYATQISGAFEAPILPHDVIYNEKTKKHIIQQLNFFKKYFRRST